MFFSAAKEGWNMTTRKKERRPNKRMKKAENHRIHWSTKILVGQEASKRMGRIYEWAAPGGKCLKIQPFDCTDNMVSKLSLHVTCLNSSKSRCQAKSLTARQQSMQASACNATFSWESYLTFFFLYLLVSGRESSPDGDAEFLAPWQTFPTWKHQLQQKPCQGWHMCCLMRENPRSLVDGNGKYDLESWAKSITSSW